MNIRDIIEESFDDLKNKKYYNNTEEYFLESELDEVISESYIDDAINDFRKDMIKLESDFYINSIILEELTYESDNYELIEESIIDSGKSFVSNVIEKVKELWRKFKSWIRKIIDSIKSFFSKEQIAEDIKSESKESESNNKQSETKKVETKKVESNQSNTDSKTKKYNNTKTKSEAMKGTHRSVLSAKEHNAKQYDMTDIKLNLNYHIKKATTVRFNSYMYNIKFAEFKESILDIISIGESIMGQYKWRYNSEGNEMVDDRKKRIVKFKEYIEKKVGHSAGSDIYTPWKVYIKSLVRNDKIENHGVEDFKLETIKSIAFDSSDYMKQIRDLEKRVDKVFSNCINEMTQFEKEMNKLDEKEANRFVTAYKDTITTTMKFATSGIKIFTAEYRSASRVCRKIIKALMKK
jgi:hypothetical protein